jgi:pimeloyl-ACP methyl ester carboxylesterase
MPKVKLNGIEMYYEEQGNGDEPIIFIHGGRSWSRVWRPEMSMLPANYHAYAPDMRGHGEMADVVENFTYPQMADDVYHFSRQLGLGKFVCAGTSMGSGVTIQLALDHPEVLKAQILGSGASQHRSATWRSPKARAAQGAARKSLFVRQPVEWFLQLREKYAKVMREEARRRDENWRILPELQYEEDVIDRIRAIKVPTLMLIGGRDPGHTPERALPIARAITGAKMVFFEDEGHYMPVESPQRVVNEITSFVSQLG